MPAIQLLISGKVQGVGYRRWFSEQAQALGLKGHVQNLSTGEVEAVMIGTNSQLQEMLAHSWRGPVYAEVQEVLQQQLALAAVNVQDFKIRP